MKKFILTSFLLIASIGFFSCSESTNPSSDPYVKVVANLTDNNVATVTNTKLPNVQAGTIDSIEIKEFRILLSRLIFHQKGSSEDSTKDDNLLKTGPFLLKLDSTGNAFTLAEGEIPAGTYDKIKFELHRFSSSEVSQYSDDSTFGEFATGDRYSVIIEGIIHEGTDSEEFTFSGTVTANLSLNFDDNISFEEGSDYTIQMEIDPSAAFVSKEAILDPRVAKDANDIDNAIKEAFKSIKKK